MWLGRPRWQSKEAGSVEIFFMVFMELFCSNLAWQVKNYVKSSFWNIKLDSGNWIFVSIVRTKKNTSCVSLPFCFGLCSNHLLAYSYNFKQDFSWILHSLWLFIVQLSLTKQVIKKPTNKPSLWKKYRNMTVTWLLLEYHNCALATVQSKANNVLVYSKENKICRGSKRPFQFTFYYA